MVRIAGIILSVILFLVNFQCVIGQTTVAFQGGEGTIADNWGFAAISSAGGPLLPGAVATFPRTGSFAIRAGGGNNVGCSGGSNCISGGGATGCPMHGKTIEFNTLNIACLSDVQLSLYHRTHSFCSGSGFDSGEMLYFEVSLNGGAWTIVGQVAGFGDYTWLYTTNPAGSGTTAPNPFVYNVPAGTSTFAFRARTNINRADEVFYIDDVKVTTTSTGYTFPGTDGLWNGIVNTNWNNPCNWDSRTIPVSATDVSIPNAAFNICEILPFSSGTCKNLVIDKQKLAVENTSSSLVVTGNLTIEVNGELDMSTNAVQGGQLSIAGNWLNKRDESYFSEEGSTVIFTGSIPQTVDVVIGTFESFYRLGVNKSGNGLTMLTDVRVDPFNSGGVTTVLSLLNGLLDMNSNELSVFNPNDVAVSRTNGYVISERPDNLSRFTWHIGSGTGTYVFPFGKPAVSYIPVTLSKGPGNIGVVTMATYPTLPDNLPWPVWPVTVNNLVSAAGLMPDNRDATVDRFWHIASTGSFTADITFSYASGELPVAPYNNPLSLKAQRYEPSSDFWQPYLPGQSATAYQVTVPGVNADGTWTLTNIVSPLPVTLLRFEAVKHNEAVDLFWTTASEINNDFFTVERSVNGTDFFPISIVPGAGTSTVLNNYTTTDKSPVQGWNYYRLMQTDYDGTVSFSETRKVRFQNDKSMDFLIYPNPVTDYFFVSYSSSEPLEIMDNSGRVILSIGKSNSEFLNDTTIRVDVSNLATGSYFLKSGDGTTGRFNKF